MQKLWIFSMLFFITAAAESSFVDTDTDGVPDKRDECSHTPFVDLVDSRGCTVKTLAVKGKQ